MSQFSVHLNANPVSKKSYPYLLDVQYPLLDSLETKLVIPLCPKTGFTGKPIKELNPLVSVKGSDHIVLTQQMAAIRKDGIGSFVCDCSADRAEILAAIDFLITGF